MADEPRFRGTVLWFSDRKGYGFITPEDDGEELFVHYSAIKSDGFRSLQVGGTVEYTFAVGGDNKPKALDVTGPKGSSIAPSFGGCISYGDRGVNNGLRRTRNSSGVCFNCDSPGHLARDCTQSSGRCRKCKASGHLARECTQTAGAYSSGSGGVGKCYSCDKPGHRARDCPYKAVGDGGTVSSGGKCYNCDQPGHLSRDCTEGDRGGSSSGNGRGGDRRGCFNCGNSGHMARDCPQEGKCYNCGEGGHLARDCAITA